MLVLKSDIRIGKLRFENIVKSVLINSNRENFTETASIVAPNDVRDSDSKVTDFININDSVVISLGYAPELELRFTGYVSKIEPGTPAKIHCENEAFVWKQKSLGPFTGKNLKLSDLLKGVGYTGLLSLGANPEIGDWVVPQNSTLLNMLEELRGKFGLLSYWRKDKTLYIAEDFDTVGFVKKFDFQRNIVKHSLDFITDAGDIKPVSHGVSIQRDNSKIELYAYYLGGEVVVSETKPAGVLNTMAIPKVSKSALESLIVKRLPRLRNTGIKGTFEAFGAPSIEHGDSVELKDAKLPERNGTWKVKGVSIDFGDKGFRQTIELDQKLST